MKEIDELLAKPNGAVFRSVDLHVHTPMSSDMDKKWQTSSPQELVQHALNNGMEVIAITDHNNARWCDKVVAAAEGTTLEVFPGVEVSTPQGHLIAIFDKNVTGDAIHGLLMNAGMKQDDLGSLNAVTTKTMVEVAQLVEAAEGIAIAAHVDGEKGFMRAVPVGSNRKEIYECRVIRAFEVTDTAQREVYLGGKKPTYDRRVPCIQSSDSRAVDGGQHQVDAIGSRHCRLKMDDVSVDSIRQALMDPEMRVRFTGAPGRTMICWRKTR